MSVIRKFKAPTKQAGFAHLLVVAVVAVTAVLFVTYASVKQARDNQLKNQPLQNHDQKTPAINHVNNSTANTNQLSAPTDLKVTASGGGYSLTWKSATSSSGISRYQIYYQSNLLTEPTSTTYQHNLPPPPPSCNPIALTYLVKAVDNSGNVSAPSNSVTVQYGGC